LENERNEINHDANTHHGKGHYGVPPRPIIYSYWKYEKHG
jgi:hypothetical protein